MSYVLDGVAILLILGLGVVGAIRGFFKTVMEIVAVVAALFLAAQFATPLAEKIYDGLFEADLKRAVEVQMADFEGGAKESSAKLLGVMPENPKQMMEIYGLVTVDDCLKKADISSRTAGKKAIDDVTEKAVRPAMVNTLTGGCFIALFVVLLAAALLAVILLNRTMSLPGINAVNRILGFIVGAVEGGVCVLIIANLLSLSVSSSVASKVEDPWITRDKLESTYVVHRFELKDNELIENVRDWAISTAKAEAEAKAAE
ncbi:MAG: CvpA family protein [Clostridia bacterium]|nr:CvpA family protein [Clostridia bacterium]